MNINTNNNNNNNLLFPYSPQQNESKPPEKCTEFDENWTDVECFKWISKNMDQNLIVKDKNFTEDNLKVLEPFSKLTDLTFVAKKNLCTYETTGKKTKRVNANYLKYQGVNGVEYDSGLCRAQTPVKMKSFYSWLLKKGELEGRAQFIFNLIPPTEQIPQIQYYSNTINEGVLLRSINKSKSEKRNIEVHTLNIVEIPPTNCTFYELGVLKHTVNEKNEQVSNAMRRIFVANFKSWKDGDVIEVDQLDALAQEIIKVKDKFGAVIHCAAGKGRTGTLAAAVIIRESIKDGPNTLGIDRKNYKSVICKLVVSLRENGGGDPFVQKAKQLGLLFKYAEYLLPENPAKKIKIDNPND